MSKKVRLLSTVIVPTVLILLIGGGLAWQLLWRPASESSALCQTQAVYVAGYIYAYAEEKGAFPQPGWNSQHTCPHWVEELRSMTPPRSWPEMARILKCPKDTTAIATSYSISSVVAGHPLKEFTKSDMSRIPLLYERVFPGSHGWVVYLDGHSERIGVFQ